MPSPEYLDPLLHRIDAALLVSGEKQSRFGLLACGDPALVSRMRRGMHVKKASRRARIEARIRELIGQGDGA